FAGDNLSSLKSSNRNIVMRVVGRADVHDANFGVVDDPPPVVEGVLPAPPLRHLFDLGLVAPANRLQPRPHGKVEELIHLPVRIAMGLAHELVPDHADSDALAHKRTPSII